jgi:5'-3' exonuclease
MTTALIDGDIICYRCAASCQKQGVTVEPVEVAIMRVDELIRRILHETGAEFYYVYLTGSNNFRLNYNPEYKANRKDTVKPEWLEQCRENLVLQWKAQVSDGCEADDLMAIEQTKQPDETIICTIDKDLLQVPGKHYNFVKSEFHTVTPKEGLFNFYWQFIMGDKSDNIFGFDGLARNTIPKKLESLYEEMLHASQMGTEQDVFDIVKAQYNDDERLLMNGRCLYMQRYEGEIWEFPKKN